MTAAQMQGLHSGALRTLRIRKVYPQLLSGQFGVSEPALGCSWGRFALRALLSAKCHQDLLVLHRTCDLQLQQTLCAKHFTSSFKYRSPQVLCMLLLLKAHCMIVICAGCLEQTSSASTCTLLLTWSTGKMKVSWVRALTLFRTLHLPVRRASCSSFKELISYAHRQRQ